jgi:hypothetical protein
MASNSNIWLAYLREKAADPAVSATSSVALYRDLGEKTRGTLRDPVRLQALILSTLAQQLVAIVPISDGRVSLLHSFYEGGEAADTKNTIGLNGFDLTAVLRTVKTAELAKGLVKVTMGKKIAGTRVPTFEQLLNAGNEEALQALEGEADQTVGSWREETNVDLVKPTMITSNMKTGASIHAFTLLVGVAKGFSSACKKKNQDPLRFLAWGQLLVRLWIIGKGWATPAKIRAIPDDTDRFDLYFASRLGAITKYMSDKGTTARDKVKSNAPESPEVKKETPMPEKSQKKRTRSPEDDYHDESEEDDDYDEEEVYPDYPRKREDGSYSNKPGPGIKTPSPVKRKSPKKNNRTEDEEEKETEKRGEPKPGDYTSDEEDQVERKKEEIRKRRKTTPENRRGVQFLPKRKPRDDPDDSDGSSSSNESPSDSSEDSEDQNLSDEARKTLKRKKKKRRRLQEIRYQRKRDKTIMRLMGAQTDAFDEMTIQSREKRNEDRAKASLLSAWTEKAKSLFKLLSAKNWQVEGTPELNKFSIEAIKDKKAQRAINQIEMTSYDEGWGGMVSQSGIIKIFAKGFQAPNFLNVPDGFTAFNCFPRSKLTDRSLEETRQFYQELFGNGDLTDEKMKTITKTDWFLPSTRHQGMDQLKVTIKLIDMLTSKNGIASAGYRYGRRLAEREDELFDQQIEKDPLFMVKFVHLLDAVFQRFCEKLVSYERYRDPILEAKEDDMDLMQERTIESALGNFFSLGHNPNLSLPAALETYKKERGKKVGEADQDKKIVTKPGGEKGAKKGKVVNPEVVSAWAIPKDKSFHLCFGGKTGKENLKLFPRLEHHVRGKGMNRPCLKWYGVGKCEQGDDCPFAHLALAKISADKKTEMDTGFTKVYSTS